MPVLGVLGDQGVQLGDPGASVRRDLLASLQILRRRNPAGGQHESPGRSRATAPLTDQWLVVDRGGVQGTPQALGDRRGTGGHPCGGTAQLRCDAGRGQISIGQERDDVVSLARRLQETVEDLLPVGLTDDAHAQ